MVNVGRPSRPHPTVSGQSRSLMQSVVRHFSCGVSLLRRPCHRRVILHRTHSAVNIPPHRPFSIPICPTRYSSHPRLGMKLNLQTSAGGSSSPSAMPSTGFGSVGRT